MGIDYTDIFEKLACRHDDIARMETAMLIAVIDLVGEGEIVNNEIKPNHQLQSAYTKVCHRYHISSENAYLPFWYLARESFWHIVPFRNGEDILDLIRDKNQQPSKSKLESCVNYVELDDDLFFLMTLSSGRTSLRESLLKFCFNLNDDEVIAYAADNAKPSSPIDTKKLYESLKNTSNGNNETTTKVVASEGYRDLPLNLKIALNISFFTFLKKNPYAQESIISEMPDIDSLYEHIVNASSFLSKATSAYASTYISLLKDLKIALMSEDNASTLIDRITEEIAKLEDTNSKHQIPEDDFSYTDEGSTSEVKITSYETNDLQSANSEELTSTPDYQEDDSQEEPKELDFFVEQIGGKCTIVNKENKKIYSSTGRVVIIKGEPYRVYRTYSYLTINKLNREGENFYTGERIINVKSESELYQALDGYDNIQEINGIRRDYSGQYLLKLQNTWYDSVGGIDSVEQPIEQPSESAKPSDVVSNDTEEGATSDDYLTEDEVQEILKSYKPKGKLGLIREFAHSPYDFLWMMAIVDKMDAAVPPRSIQIDDLAMVMIANAWEASQIYPETIERQPALKKCIEFFISESEQSMAEPLDWNSPKELVYSEIKDYPMGDDIEGIVDKLVSEAPYRVDNTWIQTHDMMDLIEKSKEFYGRCLYGIHLKKYDSFIQMNEPWIWNLRKEHDYLILYFRDLYRKALTENDNSLL
ncbi:MAG: hypothetical protein ACI4T9_06290 [Prevotella sp.]